jgi:hypothetical protein
MDFGVVALIALNNMLFAFLIWVLPRFAVVLAVALGQAAFFRFPLVVHAEPKYWLFLLLEAGGYAAAFLSGGGLCRWQAPWWRCGRGFGKGLSSRRRCGGHVGWGATGVDGGRHSHA